jgi:hypothetical protein
MNEKQNGAVWMRGKEAAGYLGVAERTLANWRSQGVGPRFYKPRGFVIYYQRDLDSWLVAGGGAISTAQARARPKGIAPGGETLPRPLLGGAGSDAPIPA